MIRTKRSHFFTHVSVPLLIMSQTAVVFPLPVFRGKEQRIILSEWKEKNTAGSNEYYEGIKGHSGIKFVLFCSLHYSVAAGTRISFYLIHISQNVCSISIANWFILKRRSHLRQSEA